MSVFSHYGGKPGSEYYDIVTPKALNELFQLLGQLRSNIGSPVPNPDHVENAIKRMSGPRVKLSYWYYWCTEVKLSYGGTEYVWHPSQFHVPANVAAVVRSVREIAVQRIPHDLWTTLPWQH